MQRLGFSLRKLAWFALVLVLIPACQDGGPTLYEVKGSVVYDGKPAIGATVVLEKINSEVGESKPSGTVQEDGSFTINTYPQGPGAAPGEYAVLITWYGEDARAQTNPKNKLPARYGDAKLTPLPKITVKEGVNQLEPFKVEGKN